MTAAHSIIYRVGQPGGRPVIYLHGAPGAPVEADLIAAAAAAQNVELWAVDRARVAPDVAGHEYCNRLSNVVAELSGGTRTPILGFSIGAALALRVAARLGSDSGPLLLLSAAGPLDIPNALRGMGAGASVFRSAQANGRMFATIVRVQALLARWSPRLLELLLFAGADSSDRDLALTPVARATLPRLLADAWVSGGAPYRRELLTYVEPWSAELGSISSAVHLWHGVSDNWAPVAMARRLTQRLSTAELHEVDGAHYSTLVGQASSALATIH